MAHVVSDECVSCGACAAVCPVEAISEGPTKYVVDPDTCIDCGACEEPCPTGAIAVQKKLLLRATFFFYQRPSKSFSALKTLYIHSDISHAYYL